MRAVRFTVEGQELTDSRNQAVGDMTEDTFVEFSGKDNDAYRYDTFTLYFTDKSGKKLVPEERRVYYRRTTPKEMVVLAQLAKGPSEEGHYRTISENSLPISAITADRICYINMNRALPGECAGGGGRCPDLFYCQFYSRFLRSGQSADFHRGKPGGEF